MWRIHSFSIYSENGLSLSLFAYFFSHKYTAMNISIDNISIALAFTISELSSVLTEKRSLHVGPISHTRRETETEKIHALFLCYWLTFYKWVFRLAKSFVHFHIFQRKPGTFTRQQSVMDWNESIFFAFSFSFSFVFAFNINPELMETFRQLKERFFDQQFSAKLAKLIVGITKIGVVGRFYFIKFE